uniref:Zinc finger protein 410 n=1 Tax=Mus musculus TaxID=10090 RepID=A0A1Y7VIW1_MOUSE
MLSDELESKPELLVQFVQNTSIPLGQGLVESEAKDITCLSLLPVTEASECSRLMLPGGPFFSCFEEPSGECGPRRRRDKGSDCTEVPRVPDHTRVA